MDEVEMAGSGGAQEDAAIERLLEGRALLQYVPEFVTVLDRAHRIRYLNRPGPERHLGALLRGNPAGLYGESERKRALESLQLAWQTGEPQTFIAQSADTRWWETRVAPIEQSGEILLLMTTTIEVTARKRAEARMFANESRLRHVIRATGMGTWSAGALGQPVEMDEVLLGILGRTQDNAPTTVEGFIELVHPADRATFIAELANIREERLFGEVECRIAHTDGSYRHILSKGTVLTDEDGALIGSYGGVLDITARKQLEAQLQQIQKMEAVGQLTAGVAHNFNNALGVILPNAELCLRRAPTELHTRLEDIVQAAERAAEMIRQLMLFTRSDVHAARAPLDLEPSVQRTAEICRTAFGSHFEVSVSLAPNLPKAIGNPGQLEQVLLNVCLNARDALTEARCPHPTIHIEVRLSPIGTLLIEVRDNGPGMEEAVRRRVFEPFFTTRAEHRGTGLGLASAYAVIAEHGGTIRCDSCLGEGTTIVIELPSTFHRPRPMSARPAPMPTEAETILLIDDEPLVRGAIRGLLELEGYAVLEAGNGAEGISIVEQAEGHIAIVILDRLMPGLSTEEVLSRLRHLDPALPVVLLSGHPGRNQGHGAAAVLEKPTSAETLLRTLRDLLEPRKATLSRPA